MRYFQKRLTWLLSEADKDEYWLWIQPLRVVGIEPI